MEKPLVSLIMPGIRVNHWEETYNSIKNSTTRPFELIIISPYALPDSLAAIPNIKLIKDFGNLSRCHQLGFLMAEGKYVTNAADDGVFDAGALDHLIEEFEALPYNHKNVIEAAYTEGGNSHVEAYHRINTSAEIQSPYIDWGWYIFHQSFMYTDYVREMGGFDCRFEAQPMAFIDFAIRCYRDGAIATFRDIVIQRVTWLPGDAGDHGPVARGQCEHDVPLFNSIHRNPDITQSRVRIPFDNWKESQSIWERRFGII